MIFGAVTLVLPTSQNSARFAVQSIGLSMSIFIPHSSLSGCKSPSSTPVAPWISGTNVPRKVQVMVGRSGTLECPATGSPQPDISWLKNGVPLTPGEDKVRRAMNCYLGSKHYNFVSKLRNDTPNISSWYQCEKNQPDLIRMAD